MFSLESEEEQNNSILIVEDNPMVKSSLKELFVFSGFEVITARNGEEAISYLKKRRFDAILCDIMMPKVDGYTLYEFARGELKLVDLPFVFLTALDGEMHKENAIEMGADEYVTKPFDPERLLTLIRRKIKRFKAIQSAKRHEFEELRKRILHTLSHEFRTPLVAIKTGSEMLLEELMGGESNVGGNLNDKLIEKSRRILESVIKSGERLENLVNDFMSLQHILSGHCARQAANYSKPIPLLVIIERFLESMIPVWEEKGFSVHTSIFCRDVCVRVYEPHILEALRRVADNTIKFARERREVSIGVYNKTDDTVNISIADSGIGFDASKILEALSAFGQIDRNRLEQQGGGLGLTIANEYVKLAGGRLHIDSEIGKGSIVTIQLPVFSESC